MDNDKRIRYIAKHYRRGIFSVNAGWKRLGLAPSFRFRRLRAVAAVAGIVVLTATAAVIYQHFSAKTPTEVIEPVSVPEVSLQKAPERVVKVIDFDNTPLPAVTERIKQVYGVEVTGLPDNAEEYILTLHYEGDATELVQTINDILDTRMSVSSCSD